MNDKFTTLVEDLNSGNLSYNQFQIAYRTHIRQSERIPEEMKDILCGNDSSQGLIREAFSLINHIVGGMELAVRRARTTDEIDETMKRR